MKLIKLTNKQIYFFLFLCAFYVGSIDHLQAFERETPLSPLGSSAQELIGFLGEQSIENMKEQREIVYKPLQEILMNLLDLSHKKPISDYMNQINNFLEMLNKDNRLMGENINTLFINVGKMDDKSRSLYVKSLPVNVQIDLFDKDAFECLIFFVKNKGKQGFFYMNFWNDADKKYHFIRIFNRILPKNLKLKSMQTVIDVMNKKSSY